MQKESFFPCYVTNMFPPPAFYHNLRGVESEKFSLKLEMSFKNKALAAAAYFR